MRMSFGTVAISWLDSYSSIMIRTATCNIIFDPVTDSHFNHPLFSHYIPNAIFVTHEHADHFDPKFLNHYLSAGVPVYSNEFVANILSNNVRPIKVGHIIIFTDLRIIALKCNHPGNEPLAFIIVINDGPTIYHPSDSDPYEEMIEIAKQYHPDIMLYSGSSIEKAYLISQLVKPGLIISPYCDKIWASAFCKKMNDSKPEQKVKLIAPFQEVCMPEYLRRAGRNEEKKHM